MEDLLWFRLYNRTIDNEKLGILSPADRWYYVALLCCKAQGILDTGDDHALLKRKVCHKLQLTPKELDDLTARLQEVTLVTEALQPVGWSDKQYVTDRPGYNAERQRKYRERNKSVTNALRNVTPPETETETETDKEKKKPVSQSLPSWLNQEAWQSFKDHRKHLKANMTPHAEKLMITRLEKLRSAGSDPNELLNTAVMNGWKSVYASNEKLPIGSKRNERLRRELTKPDHQGSGDYLGDVPKLKGS